MVVELDVDVVGFFGYVEVGDFVLDGEVVVEIGVFDFDEVC